MIYGYARVSTARQASKGNSLEEQKQALREKGTPEENIVIDRCTGTKMDRPNLSGLLEKLQPGDKLIVTKLDRFARTAVEGGMIVQNLWNRGVTIHIINMGTVDNTPMGKLLVQVLLAFAEFERDMIVERTQAGRESARAKGIRVDGRPPKYTRPRMDQAMELLSEYSYSEVARRTGISRSTLTREKRRRKKKEEENLNE